MLQPAGAVAAGAPNGRRARLDSVAATRRAGHRDLERHCHRDAPGRLGELDLDGRADICAAAAGPGREQVVAEERREDVREPADVELRRPEPARTEPGVPVPVVQRARLGAREDLVGLGHLAEAQLGVGLVRDVGMQLPGEAPERLLDRRVVGVARDAEELVVVALGRHQSSP